MKTVLIVALNPSIDAEWRVDDVLWEEKNNVRSEVRWAGGKGINVTRWISHLGHKARLIVPLGGRAGSELATHLHAEKISPRRISIHDETRVNVIVTTDAGRQMRFNPLGPKMTSDEWSETLRLVKRAMPQTSLLILTGSLPRGVSIDAYEKLTRIAHGHAVKTLLDCDGAPFAAAIRARPFLVKPNEHELGLWFGKPLRDGKAIMSAAKSLSRETQGWVLVSCGGKPSHLIHSIKGMALTRKPEKIRPINTVGAGDALLAGAAAEIIKGSDPVRWLERGIEIGTAATQLRAGKLPQS